MKLLHTRTIMKDNHLEIHLIVYGNNVGFERTFLIMTADLPTFIDLYRKGAYGRAYNFFLRKRQRYYKENMACKQQS